MVQVRRRQLNLLQEVCKSPINNGHIFFIFHFIFYYYFLSHQKNILKFAINSAGLHKEIEQLPCVKKLDKFNEQVRSHIRQNLDHIYRPQHSLHVKIRCYEFEGINQRFSWYCMLFSYNMVAEIEGLEIVVQETSTGFR